MEKKKILNTYYKIIELLGEEIVLEEMNNIYETFDVDELTKIELKELVDYLTEENFLEAELASMEDISEYVNIDLID